MLVIYFMIGVAVGYAIWSIRNDKSICFWIMFWGSVVKYRVLFLLDIEILK